MRAIGSIKGKSVDPKFSIDPGKSSDALFSVRWRGSKLYGVNFTVDATVQEIKSDAGGQLQFGDEHLLEFTNVKTGLFVVPKGEPADFLKICREGPFSSEVTHSAVSGTKGHLMKVEMTVKFTNTSDQPIILAYEYASGFGIDNKDDQYSISRPGAPDRSFTGIGMINSRQANPEFALKPGESKVAKFSVIRDWGSQPYGDSLRYFATIATLKVMPSGQIIVDRRWLLAVGGASAQPGGSVSLKDAANKIIGLFKKN